MNYSPGRSRDTIERRRATPPGPAAPSGRSRRAKGRPCEIPGAGKGLTSSGMLTLSRLGSMGWLSLSRLSTRAYSCRPKRPTARRMPTQPESHERIRGTYVANAPEGAPSLHLHRGATCTVGPLAPTTAATLPRLAIPRNTNTTPAARQQSWQHGQGRRSARLSDSMPHEGRVQTRRRLSPRPALTFHSKRSALTFHP